MWLYLFRAFLLLCFAGNVHAADRLEDVASAARRIGYVEPPAGLTYQQSLNQALSDAESALKARSQAVPVVVLAERIEQNRIMGLGIKDRATGKLDAERAKLQRNWQSSLFDRDIDEIAAFHLAPKSMLAGKLQWFWSNHFSIYGPKKDVRLTVADFDANAIASNVFGDFPNLLKSAALHPAMVLYLNNQANRVDKGNENLAREILELHTLGRDAGYTQQDVQVFAKALTGFFVRGMQHEKGMDTCKPPRCVVVSTSGTTFVLAAHDAGAKTFLGKRYDRADGMEALDMLNDLALDPRTARRLSAKLVSYFYGEDAPEDMVERVTKKYLESGGQLRVVYRALFEDANFRQARPSEFMDPYNFMMQSVRVLKVAGVEVSDQDFNRGLNYLGQGLYRRPSPDGYPIGASNWNGASNLYDRLGVIDQLIAKSGRRNSSAFNLMHVQKRLGKLSVHSLQKYESKPAEWLGLALITPEFMFH